MLEIQVDANAVIAALRNQLSTANYELAIATARAEQAESSLAVPHQRPPENKG